MRFALRASLKPNFSTGALGFRCAEDAGTSSATPVPMGLSALPNESLYQLKSPWTTDLGKRIQLENLRGKLRLVTLFFGHCESSCPMVLGKLKAVVNSSSDIWGDKAGIILVSLDPKRDDVESLSAFRKRMSLAPEAWTLLRGNEQDTRELAMALGVAYRPSTENGGMDHNAVVVLVDGVGRILKRHEGTFEVKELIDEVEAAIPKL
jgi:protein SCO1/2